MPYWHNYPLFFGRFVLQPLRFSIAKRPNKHHAVYESPVNSCSVLSKSEISAHPPPRLGCERFPAGIPVRITLGYPSSDGEFKEKHLTVDAKIILHPNAEYNPSVHLALLQVGGHSAFVLSNSRSARLDDRLILENLHFTHNSVKYKRHEAHYRHRV
jgi:hypothetical protein